ncbi:MAG: hypothetical protein HY342_04025 [Candidatus Lambdaproteobacteria bacterium]|nr:hypothetical protein [Candidatus Lambdaproteobacteria bacterium]
MIATDPERNTEFHHLEQLLRDARAHLDAQRWAAAAALLREAMTLDPLAEKPPELMAQAQEGLGHTVEAQKYHKLAKANRDEQWKRKVEAEIRSRHELVGGVVKHELP